MRCCALNCYSAALRGTDCIAYILVCMQHGKQSYGSMQLEAYTWVGKTQAPLFARVAAGDIKVYVST